MQESHMHVQNNSGRAVLMLRKGSLTRMDYTVVTGVGVGGSECGSEGGGRTMQVASDRILRPLGAFAAPESEQQYPSILAGQFVQAELEAIRLKSN